MNGDHVKMVQAGLYIGELDTFNRSIKSAKLLTIDFSSSGIKFAWTSDHQTVFTYISPPITERGVGVWWTVPWLANLPKTPISLRWTGPGDISPRACRWLRQLKEVCILTLSLVETNLHVLLEALCSPEGEALVGEWMYPKLHSLRFWYCSANANDVLNLIKRRSDYWAASPLTKVSIEYGSMMDKATFDSEEIRLIVGDGAVWVPSPENPETGATEL